MPKLYSSKDTNTLIKEYKETLRQLRSAISLQEEYSSKIVLKINELGRKGIFMENLRNELIFDKKESNFEIENLLILLYRYKEIKRESSECKKILRDNEERITKYIKEASANSNAIFWLFSSKKRKGIAEEAFEALNREKHEGIFFSSSQKTLQNVNDIKSSPYSAVSDDFEKNSKEFEYSLKDNIPNSSWMSNNIYQLDILSKRYKEIQQPLTDNKNLKPKMTAEIQQSAEKMIMSLVLDILRSVPVEELNRDKKGIRVKALRDSGYETMADIYAATEYELSTVYGISEDASYTIKHLAKNFALEARKGTKIRLSVDNKTKEATELISKIYAFKQYQDIYNQINDFDKEYSPVIYRSFKAVESVSNGVVWVVLSNKEKEKIKNSYQYLKEEISGEYYNKATSFIQQIRNLQIPDNKSVWDDFGNNSISYFNILEEICPGVLGNDDKLYGLPEELAREIQDECFFPDGLNCELRRYQEWGVKYILHQEKVLLGDEMGLGKTIQAIATMVSLRNTGATHFVVVCPASVVPNWCKEVATKSKLRVTKVHGAGRSYALKSWIKSGGVAITTYETTGYFNKDNIGKIDLLVVDEAHFIKNPEAARTQNVRKLCSATGRLLFMTGTALENRVDEMISLISVLRPGIATQIESIAFMASAPQFREKVAPVYYRRKREDVLTELPDLVESKEWCVLSEEEENLYEKDVLDKNYMATRRLSWNVNDLKNSCKARRMLEIIEEAEGEGRKVLVFSFFLDTIRKIREFLGDRCLNPINGSISPQRRQEIIDEFNDAPAGKVLCAQIQSGGTGLNIQAASVVIICEPQLKPSIENQAISRAYRMGQARNVLVYRLLCEDTIDEKITEMLEEKQEIFNAFADKSVAAENAQKIEIDEKSFGKIIEEEIERIKAKEKSCAPASEQD